MPYERDFVQALIECGQTTNEQVQFVVGNIADYYSQLLLSDDTKKIPHYYAYLSQVYKGVDFKPSKVESPGMLSDGEGNGDGDGDEN